MIGRPKSPEAETFSLDGIHPLRENRQGGHGHVQRGPAEPRFLDLSDKKLAKIFQEIDEDQSNSLSFDEFIHAVEVWEIVEARGARRLREGYAMRRFVEGGISKAKLVAE